MAYPFERAAAVFRDPRTFSIPDEEHGSEEDRLVTLGLDRAGNLLVLVHTFTQLSGPRCRVRIISTRRATKVEAIQYSEGDA
jgi:uncharacterized DUF497 family protein